jgi:hypothetical protein
LEILDYSLRSPFGPPLAFNALRAYVPAFAGMTKTLKFTLNQRHSGLRYLLLAGDIGCG